jgi:hypothetical protein
LIIKVRATTKPLTHLLFCTSFLSFPLLLYWILGWRITVLYCSQEPFLNRMTNLWKGLIVVHFNVMCRKIFPLVIRSWSKYQTVFSCNQILMRIMIKLLE